MKPDTCPTCGSLVRVVGKTTKHYEPASESDSERATRAGARPGVPYDAERTTSDALKEAVVEAARDLVTRDPDGDSVYLWDEFVMSRRAVARAIAALDAAEGKKP